MRLREFGETGIKVSELTFGGGAVGGLLINSDDEIKRKAIRSALDGGINWIDTAPSYGKGKSEEALGWLLSEVDDNPYLSTKFTVDTRDLTDLRGQIERSLETSLKRLQRNSVTLLQLHNQIGQKSDGRILGIAEILKSNGVLDILDEFKRQGLIHLVGITALGETQSIVKIVKSNRLDSAQVYYNLLNPSAGFTPPPSWPCYNFTSIMDTCREHNVATMNIRVFSAGVIATDERTGREQPLTPGDTVESESRKAALIFSRLGDKYGSRAQTAIRFALAQDKLSTIVFGLANLEHLNEALSASAMGPLPAEALEEIRAIYGNGI